MCGDLAFSQFLHSWIPANIEVSLKAVGITAGFPETDRWTDGRTLCLKSSL
jgi:hypothetical protein